jgi:hypothetical protein
MTEYVSTKVGFLFIGAALRGGGGQNFGEYFRYADIGSFHAKVQS